MKSGRAVLPCHVGLGPGVVPRLTSLSNHHHIMTSSIESFRQALAACTAIESDLQQIDTAQAGLDSIKQRIAEATDETEALTLADELDRAERLASVRAIRRGKSEKALDEAAEVAWHLRGPAAAEAREILSGAAGNAFDELAAALMEIVPPEARTAPAIRQACQLLPANARFNQLIDQADRRLVDAINHPSRVDDPASRVESCRRGLRDIDACIATLSAIEADATRAERIAEAIRTASE